MANNYCILPAASPVQLVRIGDTASAIYHSPQFGKDWFALQIQFWQQQRFPNGKKIDYTQKWQLNDPVRPQIAVPVSRVVRGYLVNCSNVTVKDNLSYVSTPYAGDFYNSSQNERYQFDFSGDILSLPEGRYWFVVEISNEILGSPSYTYEYYCSEPMHFKTSWPYTIRWEYSNNRNDYNMRFDMKRRFVFRCEGAIGEPTFTFADSSFEDQQQNEYTLYSAKKKEYEITLGAKNYRQKLLPRWVFDKITEILRCNTFSIDGKQFTRPSNNTVDIATPTPNYPLANGTVTLHGFDEQRDGVRGGTTLTYQFPTTYPFAIHTLFLMDGSQPAYVAQDVIVENQTQLLTIIAAANTQDLAGTFSLDTGTNLLTYTLGQYETFFGWSDLIYTKYFSLSIARTSGNGTFAFFLTSGVCILDWGASTLALDPVVQLIGLGNPNNQQFYSRTYFNTTASKTVRIFHNNNITVLNIPTATNGFKVTAFGGMIPSTILGWIIANQNISSVDGSFFSPVNPKCNNLKTLILYNNHTTSYSSINFDGQSGELLYIDWSGNALSVSNVNNILTDIVSPGDYGSGGSLYLKQTPPAAPTGAGAGAKGFLQLAAWNVDTN